MTLHYICTGECKGEAQVAGFCADGTCSKAGQPLDACSCEDGAHVTIVNN